MCLAPLTLMRPREEWQTQNESATATRIVPCGACKQCLRRRQMDWVFRLTHEQKVSTSSCFLTLTYTDEELPFTRNGRRTLKKKHFQDFMKRLRSKTKNKLKYYACGEYGTHTERPHYHIIMFNLPKSWIWNPKILMETWDRGHIDVAICNVQSIAYTVGYVMQGRWKPDPIVDCKTGEIFKDDREPNFSTMSKLLGLSYLTVQMYKYHKENLIGHITHKGGDIQRLPRYFKEKIFTKQEIVQINEEAMEFALEFQQLFNNENHKVQWVKHQQQEHEKQLLLNRAKV